MLFALILVPLTVSTALAGNETDLQKGEKELKGIRTEIKEKKRKLEEAGKKEKGLIGEIERIEKRLRRLEAEEKGLDREIISLEKGLLEKTGVVSALHQETERKKGLFSRRLVFLYKSGGNGYLEFLLSPEGFTDTGRRYRYVMRIATHDRELIRSYGRDMALLSQQMEGMKTDKERLRTAEDKLTRKRVEIKREREERDRLLASVREEKVRYKESIKELEANAGNLQRLLERLEREASVASRGAAAGFGQHKGLLEFPVRGEIVGFFGKEIDKDSKTAVYRKGIEIHAKAGSEIRAVYDGRVIFAGQFKGYGLMIIIDHGGGYYTLYARASKILKKLNDEIKKGDIIGEVGEDGVAGEPTLYFEVRRGGKPENPLDWLKS